MTEDNRSRNAAEHRAHADRFLDAVRVLAAQGLYDRAASQAYYALYHAVRALLLTESLQPRSHRGAQHLLNVHFVVPGHLAQEHLVTLTDLQREREEADYLAAVRIDENRYRELLERVDRALVAIDALLKARGVDGKSR